MGFELQTANKGQEHAHSKHEKCVFVQDKRNAFIRSCRVGSGRSHRSHGKKLQKKNERKKKLEPAKCLPASRVGRPGLRKKSALIKTRAVPGFPGRAGPWTARAGPGRPKPALGPLWRPGVKGQACERPAKISSPPRKKRQEKRQPRACTHTCAKARTHARTHTHAHTLKSEGGFS